MKKFISILLVFLIVFSFASCKNKKKDDNSNSVDIEYYAKLGKFPESEFKIGTSAEEIENSLSSSSSDEDEEDHDHETYQIIEGKSSILIDAGSYCYYYLKDKKEKGISYMLSYEKAFGFEIGTVSTEVKKTLSGLNYKEGEVDRDKAFFVISEDASAIECTISKYTVMFIFENDALCATAIFLTEDWQ